MSVSILSQNLFLGFGVLIIFLVCLLLWGEMLFLLLLLACFIVAFAYLFYLRLGLLLFLLLSWWSLVGLCYGFSYFVFFSGGWIFYLPYKVINTVQAGLKYSLFLCAPFLFSIRDMSLSHSSFTKRSSQIILSRFLYPWVWLQKDMSKCFYFSKETSKFNYTLQNLSPFIT